MAQKIGDNNYAYRKNFRIKVRTILAQSNIDDSAYVLAKIGMRVIGRMRSFSLGYF